MSNYELNGRIKGNIKVTKPNKLARLVPLIYDGIKKRYIKQEFDEIVARKKLIMDANIKKLTEDVEELIEKKEPFVGYVASQLENLKAKRTRFEKSSKKLLINALYFKNIKKIRLMQQKEDALSELEAKYNACYSDEHSIAQRAEIDELYQSSRKSIMEANSREEINKILIYGIGVIEAAAIIKTDSETEEIDTNERINELYDLITTIGVRIEQTSANIETLRKNQSEIRDELESILSEKGKRR